MELPLIYSDDVGLIFASALSAIAVFWSIKKAIQLLTSKV